MHSINFVTAHDGFTLADLVTYNEKKNEANGEDNNDGEDHNLSWNCGVEGRTSDATIQVKMCMVFKTHYNRRYSASTVNAQHEESTRSGQPK